MIKDCDYYHAIEYLHFWTASWTASWQCKIFGSQDFVTHLLNVRWPMSKGQRWLPNKKSSFCYTFAKLANVKVSEVAAQADLMIYSTKRKGSRMIPQPNASRVLPKSHGRICCQKQFVQPPNIRIQHVTNAKYSSRTCQCCQSQTAKFRMLPKSHGRKVLPKQLTKQSGAFTCRSAKLKGQRGLPKSK